MERSKRTRLTDRPKLSLRAESGASKKPAGAPRGAGKKAGKKRTYAHGAAGPAADKRPAGRGASIASSSKPHRGPSKNAKRPSAVNSRKVCFDILVAIADGAQLDAALHGNADLTRLEDRDRRFVRLLVTTCLRRRGQLEKTIAPLVERRPFGELEHANTILIMGAAQLLVLKTDAHAAVNSTVDLMRQAGFDRLTGLANAVMRRLTREGESRFATTNPVDNLPDWLKDSWQTHYGKPATAAMADLAMQIPTLDITPKTDPDRWAKTLEGSLINAATVRRDFDGDITRLDGFAEGEWWVQDAAAALAARLFGDITGKSVIDLCAAPGGKTAQLIAAGAKVTAVDSARKRIDRLRRNLKRLNLTADIKLDDGRSFAPDGPVDHVLVDAPCSSTGTYRRRPDIFGRRTAEDIQEMQAIQWELLTVALGWLKPGGTLVYATCSLQPEEGEDIISAVLDAAEGRYVIDPVTADQAGDFARSITHEGTLRILPSDYADIGGVDGFYIARLKSVS